MTAPLDLQDLREKAETLLRAEVPSEIWDARESFDAACSERGFAETILVLLDRIAELERELEASVLDYTDAAYAATVAEARVTSLESERAVNHTRLAANDARAAEQARRIQELETALLPR